VRVVLDTNILLSACWTPGKLEARVVEMALSGAVTPCVSAAVLEEYRDVLFREKFAALHGCAREMLAGIERVALLVSPVDVISAASDEDDNRFLECAAEGRAEYLITGNLRHYPEVCGGTRIVNARGFVGVVGAGSGRVVLGLDDPKRKGE